MQHPIGLILLQQHSDDSNTKLFDYRCWARSLKDRLGHLRIAVYIAFALNIVFFLHFSPYMLYRNNCMIMNTEMVLQKRGEKKLNID